MATINVKVRVKNGSAPIKFLVLITNIDTKKIKDIELNTPFQESFELSSGNYLIYVSGLNPDGGTTEIIVSGDFLDGGPFPYSKKTTINKDVIGLFKGKI